LNIPARFISLIILCSESPAHGQRINCCLCTVVVAVAVVGDYNFAAFVAMPVVAIGVAATGAVATASEGNLELVFGDMKVVRIEIGSEWEANQKVGLYLSEKVMGHLKSESQSVANLQMFRIDNHRQFTLLKCRLL
jgi:hypothetical protein